MYCLPNVTALIEEGRDVHFAWGRRQNAGHILLGKRKEREDFAYVNMQGPMMLTEFKRNRKGTCGLDYPGLKVLVAGSCD